MIKIGFSWPAFFFVFVWALFKRLWLIGFVFLIGLMTLHFLGGDVFGEEEVSLIFNAISVATHLAFGFLGNSWLAASLRYRGYKEITRIEASSQKEALNLYWSVTGQSCMTS